MEQTKEEIAIQQLRGKIQDVISANPKFDDDFYLLQWLKAKNLKVEKAEAHLRKSLEWRKDNGIDGNLSSGVPPEFQQRLPSYFVDGKDGGKVVVMNVGHYDMREAIEKHGKNALVQHFNQLWAKMELAMIEMNKAINKDSKQITSASTRGVDVVCNVIGFEARQLACLDVFKVTAEVLMSLFRNFPVFLGDVIFFNMNKVFAVLVSAVRPILAANGLKIEIFDSDVVKWTERLLKIMDEDKLTYILDLEAELNLVKPETK